MKIVYIDKDVFFQNQFYESLASDEITCFVFRTPKEFLTWHENETDNKPDFVFIAVYEQDESGFNESVRLKKTIKGINAIPIVFVMEMHNDDHCVKSLKYGEGYIIKPFSANLLVSSIFYHDKKSKLNNLLSKQNEELTEYKNQIKQEHHMVELIFAKHCKKNLLASDYIQCYISPASVFNGDVLLSEEGPSGSLFLAVGDVTGHGLASAIGAVPVYSAFKEMVREGKHIGNIAFKMNEILRQLLPDNMMMAAVLMELNFHSGQATIWSGGMPEVMVINKSGGIRERIISRHTPLAVLAPENFRKDIDIVALHDGDRLYFYTDGIEEARNERDEMFGSERFHALFMGDPTYIFDNIVSSHSEYIEQSNQDDDITLVEVVYSDKTETLGLLAEKQDAPVLSIPWHMAFTLSSKEMQQTDPIAQIIHFLDNAIDLDVHQDCLSTILSELYSNALEHGILGLDSSMKKTEEGFFDYYFECKKRLALLQAASISIDIQYCIPEDHQLPHLGLLTITMTHSGQGFDYHRIEAEVGRDNIHYGRGILILKALCDHLEYSDEGRTVTAVYHVDRQKVSILPS